MRPWFARRSCPPSCALPDASTGGRRRPFAGCAAASVCPNVAARAPAHSDSPADSGTEAAAQAGSPAPVPCKAAFTSAYLPLILPVAAMALPFIDLVSAYGFAPGSRPVRHPSASYWASGSVVTAGLAAR